MDGLCQNRQGSKADWRDVIIVVALLAVIFLYFRHLLWTDTYIYGELDIRRHFYFFKKISYELMRHGEVPLWIPHIYCGMPLLAASQVTPFYPIDLLLMAMKLPLNMVFNWDLLIHLVAAQVFSYLFFKRLFARRIPAIFCSMWFWNVFFLNSIDAGDALNIRAMLLVPLVFYFIEASLGNDGRPYNLLFGSLALSMQILCGGLQFTFYVMVAVSSYAAVLLIARMRRGERIFSLTLGFLALILVALAIASVQLLPAWEYSRLSVRATGIPWFKAWAIKPYQLIGYVIPMFEGRDKEHGYFGLAALVLAVYSLQFWRSWRKYFFLGLGIIAIIYSFGGNTLISSFLAGLPLVRDFRGPFRAAIMSNLSVFVLAGGTLVSLLGSDSPIRRKSSVIKFCLTSILLVSAFLIIAICSRGYAGWKISTVIVSATFVIFCISGVSFLLFFSRFKPVAGFFIILLLACDIAFHNGRFYSPTSMSGLFEKDASVDYLEQERGQGNTHFRIAAYNTAHTNYFGLFGFESANGHHPFPLARYALFLPLLKNPRVAALAGVKYYIIYAKDEEARPYDPPVKRSGDANIITLPLPSMPRAFLVPEYRVLPSTEVIDTMQGSGFQPAREAILEESPFIPEKTSNLPATGTAVVISQKTNEVIIETASDHKAILVLTDSFYPGWEAEVDGVESKILTADYVFRAVALPEGRHTVVFRFKPKSFYYGAAISVLGMVIWLVWTLLLLNRRKAWHFSQKFS